MNSSDNIPLVSVCIPARNAALFIESTLQSVLNQTYSNIEIIVSDDCSTDKTPEIVERFIHCSVQLIRQSRNLGRFANCNAVIRASRGDYILKLDADDLIDPEHIEAQVRVMEAHPQIAFAHCACRLIDVSGKQIGYERSISGSFIRNCLQEWQRYVFGPRAINIVVIRRSAFDLVGGYDERYQYSGDWAMHRALLRVGDVFYNDRILASYRVHSVGKQDVCIIQAREHLLHIQDMRREWPEGVPNKEKLLTKARWHFGFWLVISAAQSEDSRRKEILQYLPEYGQYLSLQFLAWVTIVGGAPIINGFYRVWLWLRQVIKKYLYSKQSMEYFLLIE